MRLICRMCFSPNPAFSPVNLLTCKYLYIYHYICIRKRETNVIPVKILLTGATGYIGRQLLPVLVQAGHRVVCCVRDRRKLTPLREWQDRIEVIELDFLERSTLDSIPVDIDGAYYLIHSMTSTGAGLNQAEALAATNFRDYVSATHVSHVVFLSGICNDPRLSKHLASRKNVEEILSGGRYHFTALRAGIIIGLGSASFEIIRHLVIKLPLMIGPSWLLTRSQPISIRNVIQCLDKALFNHECFGRNFDIGGPDVMTYKEMLMQLARFRGSRRRIYAMPVVFPRLSALWLYLLTPASFPLAVHLVNSMRVEVVARDDRLLKLLGIHPMTFQESVADACITMKK